MVKASFTSEGKPFLLMGLTAGNLQRLQNGQPIRVRLEDFGVALTGELMIFFGETEKKIETDFRQMGLIGPDTTIIQSKP